MYLIYVHYKEHFKSRFKKNSIYLKQVISEIYLKSNYASLQHVSVMLKKLQIEML